MIPPNYPVVGRDAFRTATGVHAAAIAKANKKNDPELADSIYSGVPAHLFGLEQVIEIGPMSGRSTLRTGLEKHVIPATDELIERDLRRGQAIRARAHRPGNPRRRGLVVGF